MELLLIVTVIRKQAISSDIPNTIAHVFCHHFKPVLKPALACISWVSEPVLELNV